MYERTGGDWRAGRVMEMLCKHSGGRHQKVDERENSVFIKSVSMGAKT